MERGVDCLSHAYLSRSLTLGGTLVAPMHIRLSHWLPAVLIVLWALSPLGSQASLRFISLQTRPRHDQLPTPAYYSYPQATWESACGNCQAREHNSIFSAAFLPLAKTGPSFQDTWGNIKIPLLKDTNETTNANGWRNVTWHPDIHYTSLIGNPLLLPTGLENMSFTMDTWYWELENATLWDANTTQPLLLGIHEYNNSYLLTNYTGTSRLWQFAVPESLERARIWSANDPLAFANISTPGIPITLEISRPSTYGYLHNSLDFLYKYGDSKADDYALRLEAFVVQRPVELNVSCTIASCNVTDIRTTQIVEGLSMKQNEVYFLTWFLSHFRDAFPAKSTGSPMSGILEAYLSDPSQNSYGVGGAYTPFIDLTGISAGDLGRRLSQVINAYWIVDNQFYNAAGGFNITSRPWDQHKDFIRNSTITTTYYQTYLYCDSRWAIALCMSSIILLLAALASAVLSFFRLAPDCTDFLSALTLNDGRIMLEGGSSLDEYDRVRLLKDVRLKIGDSRSWEQIGHTSIAQDRHVGDLKKKRLYW